MTRFILIVWLGWASLVHADAPVAQYLFPAGGQRGTKVVVHVGGLNLHQRCEFELLAPGLRASPMLQRVESPFFEGPLLPLPESQRQEDYPKAMRGEVEIRRDAPLGVAHGHVWTAQGVAATPTFIIGELPEIVENEIDGEPIPVGVQPAVTINGRIYPREDVDVWVFRANAGQRWECRAEAGRFGSPLVPFMEVIDPNGRIIRESIDRGLNDVGLSFIASESGEYRLRIRDTHHAGGPAHVYRLTIQPGTDRAGPATPNVPNARPLPAAGGEGCIREAGQIDTWLYPVRKGVPIDLECAAPSGGSRLLPMIQASLADQEVGKLEGMGRWSFMPASDGELRITVRDRFTRRAGADFGYHLRPVPPAVDFELTVPTSALTIPRGGEVKLRVQVERRGGMNAPIRLQVEGLPSGVVVVGDPVIAANQSTIELRLQADAKALIRSETMHIRGTAWQPIHPLTSLQRPLTRTAHHAHGETIRYAIALPTPFKIAGDYVLKLVPRGTVYVRRYRIERNGYDGPIEISLADRQTRHLQGATGPTFTVAAGQNEFDYPTTLPPWMETGRTCRVCVMGTATVRDEDGREHVVNYSSVQQNDQIIAVVEPGMLAVEADRASLRLQPGGQATLKVRITRASTLQGPVIVEVPNLGHFRDWQVMPLQIPAEQTEGILRIRWPERVQAVPNGVPFLIRARLQTMNGPIIAETKIEVVSESAR